ncbi:hypothetical protein I4F81_001662 [Pyropia yezoensis]|uniref:Uncharacterized protein n=1 Tax=Pyropia yezoensis TaxID=2788 RepID=A0ACC3BM82_PYRYE|nr:hypothetical protein I4F81_001662 [Neopyropia yezoensis]
MSAVDHSSGGSDGGGPGIESVGPSAVPSGGSTQLGVAASVGAAGAPSAAAPARLPVPPTVVSAAGPDSAGTGGGGGARGSPPLLRPPAPCPPPDAASARYLRHTTTVTAAAAARPTAAATATPMRAPSGTPLAPAEPDAPALSSGPGSPTRPPPSAPGPAPLWSPPLSPGRSPPAGGATTVAGDALYAQRDLPLWAKIMCGCPLGSVTPDSPTLPLTRMLVSAKKATVAFGQGSQFGHSHVPIRTPTTADQLK